jgi:tripartite-type tricarboxylate transporter receptor subunit TctC
MKIMTRVAGAVLAGSIAAAAGSALAQTYPAKPVRIIVPFPPGGTTDLLARTFAAKLSESLGQQVVVENRAGATGNIGADAAAKSAPDGYTLVIGQASNLAINPTLMGKQLPYDPVKDFAPVTLLASTPNVLVVHPSLPVRSVRDLVALAKSKPGAILYATSGNGSPGHFCGALLNKLAGISMVHIPYKGAGPALIDVVGGHASLYFTSMPSAQPFVPSGRLRVIAQTSMARSPSMPDLPTVAEAGYPGYDITSWWGVLTPAGVPKDIAGRLHTDIVRIANTVEMKERLNGMGTDVVTNTPEQFAAYIKAEIAKWAKVIRETGVRLE